MPPLPLVSPLYNLIFTVTVIAACGPDAFAIAREWIAPQGERRDRGSFLVCFGFIALGWLLASVCAAALPAASIGREAGSRLAVFWAGLTLVVGGMAFRYYAIVVLGRYFTRQVTVHAGQTVVDRGPYRYIRHPSYTGLLIALIGVALALNNWAGLAAMLLCAAPGFAYRIAVEERELRGALGDAYRAYMARTRRLIPFVF